MSNPLIITNSIAIDASAANIWNALVNPEETKKYMFGCEAVSDWQIGSTLLWQAKHEGVDMVFVKGNIVDIEKENYLAYTTIDPNNKDLADLPENYLTVTYTITSDQGNTVLTITQGDYAKVGGGEKRYEETLAGGGWEPILVAIKELVEEKAKEAQKAN